MIPKAISISSLNEKSSIHLFGGTEVGKVERDCYREQIYACGSMLDGDKNSYS